jgi:hypothetical protein
MAEYEGSEDFGGVLAIWYKMTPTSKMTAETW